jgi:plasmid stabilization system protein ParE
MRKIIVSPMVVEDIEQTWFYIASDNRQAADAMLNKFESAIEMLSRHPGIGHERKDVSQHKYRFWCVKPYLIVYTFDDKFLNIKRILHGSRNIRRILK